MSDTTTVPPHPDEPSFLGFEPAPLPGSPTGAPAGYRVLARKYRPQTFDDLIGQDAMVRTVSNAFETGRIPQAWMLTGVRGVGKTTTARILARALNYELPGEGRTGGGPRVAMPELGLQCRDIIESRHVDVLEMDAASHTGVDDVRQIIDGIRYGPAQARYKVYIIDEVHMLSASAFAAFLKTLEEPPPHAKFVFATTEIRKVPVTILSRCQRFDLRRVEADRLIAHLDRICRAESVTVEPEALAAIARAAEGSVRDALSLLDQAVAHGAGTVTAEAVRDMLGLADRGRIIDLFEAVMRGDVPSAFAALRKQYDSGADPAAIISDLAAFTHLVTRLKLVPQAAADPGLSEAERVKGAAFASALSVRTLSRAWQMLLKALPEVQGSGRPVAAAEMVLVRLAYAADLPTPDEALRALRNGTAAAIPASLPISVPGTPASGGASGSGMRGSIGGGAAEARQLEPAVAAPAETMRLRRFEDVVALAGERREISLKAALERDVRLVRFEDGQVEFALAEGGNRSLAGELSRKLTEWTGRRWMVALSSQEGEPTLHERAKLLEADRRSGATAHPLVQAVLTSFPGATIVDVRERLPAVAEAGPESIEGGDAPLDPDRDEEF